MSKILKKTLPNNLCCTLNPYFKNRSKKYCLTCYKSLIKETLLQRINWDDLPNQIAAAQRDFLLDHSHKDGWEDALEDSTNISTKVANVFDKILGLDLEDEFIDEAWGIYDELLNKAADRVKIVVE